MKNVLKNLVVRDVMQPTALTLTMTTRIYDALIQLNELELSSAPVIGAGGELKGFISNQDLLRGLWSQEFECDMPLTVGDLMQTEIMSVTLDDRIEALLEFMVVDKEALFPVNSAGILMDTQYQSYETRLRNAGANKPRSYPVVVDGKLQGVVTREGIAAIVSRVYTSLNTRSGEAKTDSVLTTQELVTESQSVA